MDAISDGTQTIDLTYRLPRSAVAAAQALGAILDEADEYYQAGQHLLTLATPADVVAYRQWFLGQFIDRAGGRRPVTWAEYDQSLDPADVSPQS